MPWEEQVLSGELFVPWQDEGGGAHLYCGAAALSAWRPCIVQSPHIASFTQARNLYRRRCTWALGWQSWHGMHQPTPSRRRHTLQKGPSLPCKPCTLLLQAYYCTFVKSKSILCSSQLTHSNNQNMAFGRGRGAARGGGSGGAGRGGGGGGGGGRGGGQQVARGRGARSVHSYGRA